MLGNASKASCASGVKCVRGANLRRFDVRGVCGYAAAVHYFDMLQAQEEISARHQSSSGRASTQTFNQA